MAQRLVSNGNAVVLVNGLAKGPKSVSGAATMSYFLKPLTCNSSIADFLIGSYPGPWTVVEAAAAAAAATAGGNVITTTITVLATLTDAEIWVPGTNTLDLRAAIRPFDWCKRWWTLGRFERDRYNNSKRTLLLYLPS